MDDTPLIEDPNLLTVYFDGVCSPQVFGSNIRMLAFEFRKNPITGIIERVGVCRFVRPIEATEQIRAEYDSVVGKPRLRAVN